MNLRLELNQKIGKEICPEDCLVQFVNSSFHSCADYWTFRRLFTQQFALSTFMSYVLSFGHRTPTKYGVNLGNGQVTISEVLPSINNSGQIALLDAVPFRFTPNLQRFMGPCAVEGVFAESLRSTASIFAQVEKGDLGLSLPLFLRDELAAWLVSSNQQEQAEVLSILDREAALFNSIHSFDHDFCTSRLKPNIELFNKRVLTLACVKEAEVAQSALSKNDDQIPCANQAILDLISCATNPQKLALMDPVWQPWF